MKTLNILLIEDMEADFLLISRHIRKNGLAAQLHWVQDEAGLSAALDAGGWDLVLSDFKVPGIDFLDSLQRMKTRLTNVPIILVSGSIGEEKAVELFGKGLADFVLKDRLARLVPAILRCVEEEAERDRRREAEARLVRSEQLMRSVLEGTSDAIYVKDRAGRYLLFNHAAANCTGRDAAEVISRDDSFVFPPEDAHRIMEEDQVIMDSGEVRTREEEITHLHGAKRFYLVTKGPVFDHQGQVAGLFGISRDITERKQTEALLQRQEEQFRQLSQEYRTLLDNVPDGIVHLAPDLRIRWANAAAQRMFKLGEEYLYQARSCHEAFWNRAESCAHCPVVSCRASRRKEIGYFSPKGDEREFEIQAVPMVDDQDRLEGIIGIVRDISEHRQLQEQFHQAQKMESIGTFAGGIAHDFNNILSAILGYGDMVLEDLDEDHPARPSVQTILEAGMRASHLTKDLLLFSRKQISHKEPVDINQVITRIEKFIRRVIGEDIQCETRLTHEPLVLFADSHQMDQVLMNFATNARDAMRQGGCFAVSTKRVEIDQDFIDAHGFGVQGPYALITAADTGKGMDRQTVSKIFEPFFTTKEMGKGTGLGLAVVYGIIKEHQGFIEVQSEPGKGTTISVYLPLHNQEDLPAQDSGRTDKPRGSGEVILLAEDDPSARELFSTILTNHGYEVLAATNGEEALRLFAQHEEQIDMLVFDLVMPKLNGKQAVEAIRQVKPGIRALFVSGYAPENIPQDELRDLHIEILSKPFTPGELLRAVRAILNFPAGSGL